LLFKCAPQRTAAARRKSGSLLKTASVPLADVYAAGERRALWNFLDGHISEIVIAASPCTGRLNLSRYLRA
jgi:hypothetical protein